MTSTIFSSKELKAFYKWALGRNKSIVVVYSIILGLIGPVFNMYAVSVGSDGDSFGAVTIGVFVAVVALFTLISAVKTFSFLHNKRSVDMYGAMPANRPTMFMSHLLAGLTTVIVPYLVATFLVMGISMHSAESISYSLYMVLFTVLMAIASYLFTALMAYCCGTVVDTIIATFAVNIIWSSAVLIYFGFVSDLMPGMSMDSVIESPILSVFSPYTFGYMGLAAYFENSKALLFSCIIWDILFIAVAFLATFLLCKKRKAESSQNGFAVKWLPMALEAGASLIAGALFGYIFASTSSSGWGNMFVYVFWYLVMSAVAFIILHIVFARGLKGGFAKSVIVYGAVSLAAILLTFGLCYGMGIDTYVPSASSLSSVEVDYGKYVFKEKENIETITQIHQLIVDNIRNDNEYPYYFGYDDSEYEYGIVYEEAARTDVASPYSYSKNSYPYVDGFDFEFKYRSKLGIITNRNYYIYYSRDVKKGYDFETLNELCKKLVNSDEYKKADNAIVFDEKERKDAKISSVSVDSYSFDGSVIDDYISGSYNRESESYTIEATDAFLNGLYAVLQKDILADKNYVPNARYGISGKYYDCIGKGYWELNFNGTSSNWYYSDDVYVNVIDSVLVKESYTNTRKYLEDNGLLFKSDENFGYGYINPDDPYDSSYDFDDYAIAMNYYGEYCKYMETGEFQYFKSIADTERENSLLGVCAYHEKDITEEQEEQFTEAYDKEVLRLHNVLQKENAAEGDVYLPDSNDVASMVAQLMKFTFEYVPTHFWNDSDSDTDTNSKPASDTDVTSSKPASDSDKADTDTASGNDKSGTDSVNNNSKSESKLDTDTTGSKPAAQGVAV
ncbi:MAG: hypothetical protein K2M82_03410 [Lachnospiraceae bacterium]|nr:hypothetical protein [Lachnospiraceae bacterium]